MWLTASLESTRKDPSWSDRLGGARQGSTNAHINRRSRIRPCPLLSDRAHKGQAADGSSGKIKREPILTIERTRSSFYPSSTAARKPPQLAAPGTSARRGPFPPGSQGSSKGTRRLAPTCRPAPRSGPRKPFREDPRPAHLSAAISPARSGTMYVLPVDRAGPRQRERSRTPRRYGEVSCASDKELIQHQAADKYQVAK